MLRKISVYRIIMGEILVIWVGIGYLHSGVSSSVLLNLVMDELLIKLDHEGHKALGCAR